MKFIVTGSFAELLLKCYYCKKNWFNDPMIYVIGGTLSFFFEFLLLSKKNKSLSDKILIFWMLSIGIHLFLYYFAIKGIDYQYPFLLGIIEPLPLIHGPFLFLYTGALTGQIKTWKGKHFLHFSPVALFFIYYFRVFISPPQEKIDFVKKLIENPDPFFRSIYPAILVSGFTYITLTFFLFRKHRQNILNTLSNSNEKKNLHWLRNLIIGLLAVWIVVFASDFFIEVSRQSSVIHASVVLFVVLMGYFGVRQGNIFAEGQIEPVEVTTKKDQARYIKSGLKKEQAIEIQQKINELMETKKLFLDENLSLPQLAGMLEINPTYLSQVINERFNKNFFDFVNSYRIDEFKRLVAADKNKKMTFFALARDCGFNSKASFNNSFKKLTGMTPSDYVKSSSPPFSI